MRGREGITLDGEGLILSLLTGGSIGDAIIVAGSLLVGPVYWGR